MEGNLVQVWNVIVKGKKTRVATIEQGPRKTGMCEGCPAPCCRGLFRPILNQEELLFKKFPTMFIEVPKWLRRKVPRAEKVAVLAFTENNYCNYFDPASAKCMVWPNCPKGCLAYDCRDDPRSEVRGFAEERMKTW